MITAHPVSPHAIRVVIETPRSSRNRYLVDPNNGRVLLDGALPGELECPIDFGFVVGATGSDGRPLEAAVWLEEPTFPGCEIIADPVAVVSADYADRRRDLIVCAPVSVFDGVSQLPDSVRREVAKLLATIGEHSAESPVLHWGDRRLALELLLNARRRRICG